MSSKKGSSKGGGATEGGSSKKAAAKDSAAKKGAAKKGGTSGPIRTVNGNDDGSVVLNLAAGDFLIYKVEVSGIPAFSLVEGTNPNAPIKALIRSNPNQQSYQRRWPQANELPVAPGTVVNHTLSMSFAAGLSYDFVVEHHVQNGALLRTCTDITWSAQGTQNASRFEPFVVRVV